MSMRLSPPRSFRLQASHTTLSSPLPTFSTYHLDRTHRNTQDSCRTMASLLLFSLLFAIVTAINLVSADLWTCLATGASATKRTIGYYDTNYAGTECGECIWRCVILKAIADMSQVSIPRAWSLLGTLISMLPTPGLIPNTSHLHS